MRHYTSVSDGLHRLKYIKLSIYVLPGRLKTLANYPNLF